MKAIASAAKGRLEQIDIIRLILIVLLVFYHAFAPFSGAWKPIAGAPEIPAYWWLDKLSYSFMLEAFVFISGFVFGYQVRTKGESRLLTWGLFWNKFKRLFLPSIFFSFLYILLFQDLHRPFWGILYDVLDGVAHMWFLPMLFWCFVGVFIIERFRLNSKFVVILLIFLALLPVPVLPFQIHHTCYYLLFFYIGYQFQRNNVELSVYYILRAALSAICLFIILFPALTYVKEYVGDVVEGGNCQRLIDLLAMIAIGRICQIIYSAVGIIVLMISVGTILRKRLSPLPKWCLQVAPLCMGVYLFQQFILKALYYYTDMAIWLNPYIFPWVGFLTALILSIVLSWLVRQNKFGRFMIG